MNICVFASGNGSNFRAIIGAKRSGFLSSDICLLITNNSGCGAVGIAKQYGIDVYHISRYIFKDIDEDEYSGLFISKLKEYKIDLIVLAGYMKKIDTGVIHEYSRRIINIHPAILPSFGGSGMYGINVHKAVLNSGVKITGLTVHFVDDNYDKGEIILQKFLDVHDDDNEDSLQKRVLSMEHKYYSEVIKEIETGKIKIGNNFS